MTARSINWAVLATMAFCLFCRLWRIAIDAQSSRLGGRFGWLSCSGSSPASAVRSGSLVVIAMCDRDHCAGARSPLLTTLFSSTIRAERTNDLRRRKCWRPSPLLILVAFTFLSYLATRGLAASSEALAIEVTGYQWWWNVKYESPDPSQVFDTANEIHVPVGRPVKIDLKAADVIHSFWVPNLTGKQDLIPGQDNVLSFTARRAGRYRGQCAEFCGWQHAHMAFLVIAESEADFEAWRAEQLKAANSPPAPDAALAGASRASMSS